MGIRAHMKTRFARALFAAAVCGVGIAFGTAAEAGPITVSFTSTVDVAYTPTGNNPKLTFDSTGLNGTLTLGVPDTINDFITVTVGTGNSSDDGTVTADFTFTLPTPSGTTTDSGQVVGAEVEGSSKSGSLVITWPDQPVTFDFADGTELQVTLGDLSESCSGSSSCLHAGGPYDISGTFDLVSGPTPVTNPNPSGGPTEVPEPSSLVLVLAGLGLLGGALYFRPGKVIPS